MPLYLLPDMCFQNAAWVNAHIRDAVQFQNKWFFFSQRNISIGSCRVPHPQPISSLKLKSLKIRMDAAPWTRGGGWNLRSCALMHRWVIGPGRPWDLPWKQLVRVSSGINTYGFGFLSLLEKNLPFVFMSLCLFSLYTLKTQSTKRQTITKWLRAHITSIWWGWIFGVTPCFNFGCDENLLRFQPCWTLRCPGPLRGPATVSGAECCVRPQGLGLLHVGWMGL